MRNALTKGALTALKIIVGEKSSRAKMGGFIQERVPLGVQTTCPIGFLNGETKREGRWTV